MFGSFKDRLADMVKANVYDLLELTELLPDQSDNDLDQSERFTRDELGRQIARRHRLSSQPDDLQTALDMARQKAEQAVETGQDDLARMAIAEQLALDQKLKASRAKIDKLNQSITALETLLHKLGRARKTN